jgi:hypothetical protein
MKKTTFLITVLLFTTISFSQTMNLKESFQVTGEEYVTGEDGILRIYVNVWGHVENPGTYLIFDGANIIDILSLAGGPKDGSNLNKIKIVSKNNEDEKILNFKEMSQNIQKFKIEPFDTIVIEQTAFSKLNENSRLYTILLQLLNLTYTINNIGD